MAVCSRCGAQAPDQIGPCPNCGTIVNPFSQTGPGPMSAGPVPAAPTYGQPAYGQPAYGQPAYGQSAYGQPGPYPAASNDANYHGLIPYKNTYALLAYYTGILAVFPCVPVLGIGALVLGIMGLRDYKRDPSIKGAVHAWIGIVLGGGTTLVYGALSILIFVSAIYGNARIGD